MTTRIKLRRDTAANWTSNDPVLALGEAGYDTTNNELRVGDGTTAWSGLESIGGTGNKITAQKTYEDNYDDGDGQTFTYTTGSIAVQMANNEGLYLDDLLSRLSNYFDGNTTFPYNYSDVSLVINPGTTNLSTTVTDVISQGGTPRLYTITLATTDPGPIAINDIDFNYNYINTIGLDIEGFEGNGYFGMATGDDDITIRSGRDITLDATDDIYVSAGDYFELKLVNLDDNGASSGIQIVTETTASSYAWTFRFDGHLRLPEGLSLPTKTNTGYEYDYTLNGPTLRLSNDSGNQVIVTGPATTEANPSAQRIVIQGQRGFGVWSTSTYTVGEGGDVYIWGGTGGESQDWTGGRTGGSGGDVKLRGGQGQDHDGGYVRIEGGNTEIYNSTSTGYGGFVEITGGDVVGQAGDPSDPGKGGDVTITGGRARSASTLSGIVQVITGGTTNPDVFGANTWTFSNDGSLTVPGNIIPDTDVAYDLGSPANRFRDLYLSTSTVYIGTSTISISETGQMLVNGNDAVSKLEYFGGEGNGPRDAGFIAWNTSTFTFNIPGKELLTAIYDLKPGNKIRAANTNGFDQEFTIVGNARQYTRGFSNEYLMAAVDVAESTSTNVYAFSLYLPVKDKSATLANGTWTLSLSALGGIVFPDGSTQRGASISVTDLKTLVTASTDFADFKTRIAAL